MRNSFRTVKAAARARARLPQAASEHPACHCVRPSLMAQLVPFDILRL